MTVKNSFNRRLCECLLAVKSTHCVLECIGFETNVNCVDYNCWNKNTLRRDPTRFMMRNTVIGYFVIVVERDVNKHNVNTAYVLYGIFTRVIYYSNPVSYPLRSHDITLLRSVPLFLCRYPHTRIPQRRVIYTYRAPGSLCT